LKLCQTSQNHEFPHLAFRIFWLFQAKNVFFRGEPAQNARWQRAGANRGRISCPFAPARGKRKPFAPAQKKKRLDSSPLPVGANRDESPNRGANRSKSRGEPGGSPLPRKKKRLGSPLDFSGESTWRATSDFYCFKPITCSYSQFFRGEPGQKKRGRGESSKSGVVV
jgi:hypothetical protein